MLKAKTIRYFMFLCAVFFIYSCDVKTNQLPNSTGGSSEVIVVLDKYKWEGATGDILREFFERPLYGLPQPEPTFKLVNIVPESFTGIFQSHRNILIVEVDPKFTEPRTEVKKDIQAQPQKAITITCANDSVLKQLLTIQIDQIIDKFVENEYDRITRAYKKLENTGLRAKVNQNFGFYFTIPESFYLAKTDSNFVWIRCEAAKFSQAIMVYSYSYEDTLAFSNKKICQVRDSICKKYIPGPSEGTFMSISNGIEAISRKIDFKGKYAIETRGMWEVKKEFMGGPFVNYTFVDEKTNKVITLDAYVYAPKEEKLNYLRQVEAILNSINIQDSVISKK